MGCIWIAVGRLEDSANSYVDGIRESPLGVRLSSDFIEQRVQELRELLHERGMPEIKRDEFIRWAKDDEFMERVEDLIYFLEELASNRKQIGKWVEQNELDQLIEQGMNKPPEAFMEWVREIGKVIGRIELLIYQLDVAGTPRAVIDHLVRWMLDAGPFELERFEILNEFAKSLERLPFSADAIARRWRTFLVATHGDTFSESEALRAWIEELELVT